MERETNSFHTWGKIKGTMDHQMIDGVRNKSVSKNIYIYIYMVGMEDIGRSLPFTVDWKVASSKRNLSQLKNRDKFLFESATFQSTVNGKDLPISSMPTISFYSSFLFFLFACTFDPNSIYPLMVNDAFYFCLKYGRSLFLVPSILSSIWLISFHHQVWGKCNFSLLHLTS